MPLRPVLIIGVGGSGGKTLRTLREVMLRRLRQAGWTQPRLPDAWQMLAIDTITDASPESYDAAMLPESQYVGLTPPTMNYTGLREQLLQAIPRSEQPTAIAGWLPKTIPNAIGSGAGQNRAIGRTVAAANLSTVRARIAQSYAAATTAQAALELQSVSQRLKAEQMAPSAFAIVISSLAGGSGSGMFLDVIEALKSVDAKLAAEAQVVLFGPDVFAPLVTTGSGTQIAGNTLAAIGEVTAGSWRLNAAPGTQALYRKAGMHSASYNGAATGAGVGIGARSYYVIGASNADGTPIGHMDKAYRALGDSLSSLIMDERVLDKWFAVFLVNIFQNSWQANVCGDSSGLVPTNDERFTMPFASFGSSRVSLGMDRLADYASQRAARATLEALLWPALTPPDASNTRTSPQKVQDRIAERWNEFRSASGLDEREPANQVMDVLLDPEAEALASRSAAQVVAKAGSNGGRGLAPEEWVSRLRTQFTSVRDTEFMTQTDAKLRSAARRWGEQREAHLARLLTEYATRDGILVTAGLLNRLREDCRFVGAEELPAQAAHVEHILADFDTVLAARLNVGLRVIPANHPTLAEAQNLLAKAFKYQEEAARARLVAGLLLDLEKGLLARYYQTLDTQRDALLAAVNSPTTADGRPNRFRSFPGWEDPVPDTFKPGPTEFPLIPVEEQPAILEDLIRRSVPAGLQGQAKGRLIERVALRLALDERGDHDAEQARAGSFFTTKSSWMPSDPELRWVSGGSAMASTASMPTSVDWFVDAARGVLGDEGSEVGSFLSQSLDTYLSPANAAERQRREQTFADALRSAFEAGKPLAQTNDNLIAVLHPQADPALHQHVVSTIPVATGSPLYAQLQNALSQIGVWNPSLSPSWFGSTTAAQVDIFQAPSTSMSATAFKTLTDTVSAVWHSASGNKDEREAFWSNKRSRPLMEAIPVEESLLKQMARGWVVAGLLNLRTADWTNAELGPRVTILDDRGKLLPFPFPLLGRDIAARHLMAAVLNSVLLAMMEAGAGSNLDPFLPYKRLLQLGVPMTKPEHELSQWILYGRSHPQLPVPDGEKAGPADGTEAERRKAVMHTNELTLRAIREDFRKIQDPADSSYAPDPFVRDIAWELRDLVFEAYDKLSGEIDDLQSSSTINY